MLRRDYSNTALLWSQVHQVAARLKLWLSKPEVDSMMAAIAQCLSEDALGIEETGHSATYNFPDGSQLRDGHGPDRETKGSEIGYEIAVTVLRKGDGSETRALLDILTSVHQRAMELRQDAISREDGA